MSHRLFLYPYCGGHTEVAEGDIGECRQAAARAIAYHRNKMDYPVTILDRGVEWELESDPEGRHMIGGGEGILSIKETPEPEPDEEDDDIPWDLAPIYCENCERECDKSDLTDGLCPDCWDCQKSEGDDDES